MARRDRLRSTADFARLQQGGRRMRLSHVIGLWSRGEAERSRYGVTVSRKVGNAVVRNRVKRRLRQALRVHRGHDQAPLDLVIVAQPAAARATYQELATEVRQVLARAVEQRS